MKPLREIAENSTVKITGIDCGDSLNHRLCDMGIYAGTSLKVIRNRLRGPMIIKVLNTRLVIGDGQSRKILVEEVV